MRKIFGIVLSSLMLLVFTACGSTMPESTDTPETPGDSTSDVDNTKDTNSGEQLVIWAWDQNLPSINYAKEQYAAAHPDSTLEVVVQNVPDTVDKMSTFFASGIADELPDLVLMDNVQIQTFLQQFPDKFVNLSEKGFDAYKDDFSEAHWQLLSQNGSIYAFPFDIAPIMMEVNTDIMSEVGIDPESLVTWQDMIDATPAVNDAGYAMHIKLTENDIIAMMQSAGVGIFDENRNIDLLNPKVVEVVETFQAIVANNTSDSVREDQSTFGEGSVATIMKPAWSIGEDMPVQTDIAGKVTLVPMPKIRDEEGYTSSANNGGSSFFILNSSSLVDEAYEIGTYITTDLESQKIALEQGLMPGYLPAAELDVVKNGVDYYNGEPIWLDLLESSKDTVPISVNEYYSAAKDIVKNSLVDTIVAGSDKSAKEILQETADMIAGQTGLSINQY